MVFIENRIRGHIYENFIQKKSIFAFVLLSVILFSGFGCPDTLNVSAQASEIYLLQTAVAHLNERVDDLEEAVANSDTETVNTKIAELEEAIIAAEASAKAYADTQDEALKNELSAAIESAKAELAGTDNTNTNVEAINARITELDTAVTAMTKELNDIRQNAEELENKNDELQTVLIIVCVISGVTFCGCGTFVIWFFIDKKKRI